MRKHNFVDKHPVLSSILICLFMMIAEEFISSVFQSIHIIIDKEPSELFQILYMLISATIVFLAYKWWFRPDFEGTLKGGNLSNPLKYFLPFIIYWIITFISMLLEKSFSFKGITLQILYISLTAGIVEEMAFRHGIVSTLLKNKNQKDQLYKVVLVSCLVFGLFHATNLIAGANLPSTINQVLTSTCFGIYFSILYMRCGNLLYPIILHTIHDIYAISSSSEVTAEGIIAGGLTLSSFVDLFGCIALAIYAIKYLLPEQEKEKVVAIWNRKWNKDNIETTIE